MAYNPNIQDPPTTGDDAFDLWLKRFVDETRKFMVKSRELGNGLQYDALDRIEVGYGFMQRNKV